MVFGKMTDSNSEKSTDSRAGVDHNSLLDQARELTYSQKTADSQHGKISASEFEKLIDFAKLDQNNDRQITREELRSAIKSNKDFSDKEKSAIGILDRNYDLIKHLSPEDGFNMTVTRSDISYIDGLTADFESNFDQENATKIANAGLWVGAVAGVLGAGAGCVALAATGPGGALLGIVNGLWGAYGLAELGSVVGIGSACVGGGLGYGATLSAGYGISSLIWNVTEKPSREKLLREFS